MQNERIVLKKNTLFPKITKNFGAVSLDFTEDTALYFL